MTRATNDAEELDQELLWAAWYLTAAARRLRTYGPETGRVSDLLVSLATRCSDLRADLARHRKGT